MNKFLARTVLCYPGGVPGPDRGVLITRIADEIERVRERLAAYGRPLDYPRDLGEAE